MQPEFLNSNKLILLVAMAIALATNVTAQVGAIDLNRPKMDLAPADRARSSRSKSKSRRRSTPA